MDSILFVPVFLLTILYSINLFFLRKKELPAVWKYLTLFFNVLAILCSIPTAYVLLFVFAWEINSKEMMSLTLLAIVFYFFVVNILLSFLLIIKKAIRREKPENQHDISVLKENKKLKLLGFAFLYAVIGILVFRSIYAEDKEILFVKGNSTFDFYLFYFITIIFTALATAILIRLYNRQVLIATTGILGGIFAVVLLLNFIIKPTDYAALSRGEKESFLESSSNYLEELYPEGIAISNIAYEKSKLGGKYIRVYFNYELKDCKTNNCGPYEFDANYHIFTHTLMDVADSGQKKAADQQSIVSENNKDLSFIIEQNESVIVKEEKGVFIEKGHEAKIKEQVLKLIDEGYGFSTNNGLQPKPNNHYDRLKFTEFEQAAYKKLLSIDANDFYESIKSESEYSHSDLTEFVLKPLGYSYGKIVIEVSPEGYVVKGLPFKIVDSRARFHFDFGNGETFTGVLESDHQYRADRVWVTIEDEGASGYSKGEFTQVLY
ncbi:hypothetical protein D1B33_08315 [Lysinibacillus yapensis]|uniref:Uncharacterized protein n=1 Tax=Ureibacillus yapensis TaxID=2304605 RepID=A0A396S8W0_9BACL|nr:hypothetical protein [Lysinibacillus yapensis]RHW37525.1 hypothetical protein D1B33_08315 [Lysinibacillus yapensis]